MPRRLDRLAGPGAPQAPRLGGRQQPLPGVPLGARCGNLASKALGLCLRRPPHDFQRRYGYRPLLVETFCEIPRFRGTCYRAANWIHVGQTQGRGKLDTHYEYALPVKDIFLKPLCPDWKDILNR